MRRCRRTGGTGPAKQVATATLSQLLLLPRLGIAPARTPLSLFLAGLPLDALALLFLPLTTLAGLPLTGLPLGAHALLLLLLTALTALSLAGLFLGALALLLLPLTALGLATLTLAGLFLDALLLLLALVLTTLLLLFHDSLHALGRRERRLWNS